jgi:arsenite-transporting ATPase
VRLLLFAGKGGVGKTSCAAAVALALAARDGGQRVLLLSTDPAHSLADVLATPLDDETRPVAAAPPGLLARELDADRAFAARRARYRQAVDDLFIAVRDGSRFEAAFDRQVVADLIELAPSGLDELFGILAVTEAVDAYETVVVDTAPTGHALRLLAMPDAALEWVHALMAILLKYRKAIGLGELGVDLVEAARDLRRLTALLQDPTRTRLVPIARPSEMVRLETRRLVRDVRRLGIPQTAMIVNAVTAPACARCRRAAARQAPALSALARECRSLGRGHCDIILAPMVAPPPRGAAALTRWRARWKLDGDPH